MPNAEVLALSPNLCDDGCLGGAGQGEKSGEARSWGRAEDKTCLILELVQHLDEGRRAVAHPKKMPSKQKAQRALAEGVRQRSSQIGLEKRKRKA